MHDLKENDENQEKKIEKKAFQFLNGQLGSNPKNLSRIEDIVEQLSKAKQDLEDKVSSKCFMRLASNCRICSCSFSCSRKLFC